MTLYLSVSISTPSEVHSLTTGAPLYTTAITTDNNFQLSTQAVEGYIIVLSLFPCFNTLLKLGFIYSLLTVRDAYFRITDELQDRPIPI